VLDTLDRMTFTRPLSVVAAIAACSVLAACGSDDDSSSSKSASASPSATAAAECTKDTLATLTKGRLTVATDKPAYPPYFEDDNPTNGKGFESSVAYAIADKLGFAKADVKWTVVPFNSSYAPGPKKFDFDVNQISITNARKKRVDFSSPYFTAPQAVVALNGTGAAKATSLAALQSAKLGVQVGTTSLDAVQDSIKPSSDPQVFNDSNDTVRALKTKRVDAVVVDLPTAFYLTGAQIDNAKIVGQFNAPGGDSWGALLEKGSKLTPCVSKAVDELKADGTLAKLQNASMGGDSAPQLR
jgi:polar amino acid transport system substrate-binding protein